MSEENSAKWNLRVTYIRTDVEVQIIQSFMLAGRTCRKLFIIRYKYVGKMFNL